MNLDKYTEFALANLKKPLVTAILGLLVGLIIGLPVLGWGLVPVKWVDAAPIHLRPDLQEDYMRMVIESYAFNQDSFLALSRWKEFGDQSAELLQVVQTNAKIDPGALSSFSLLVGVPYSISSDVVEVQPTGEVVSEIAPSNEITIVLGTEEVVVSQEEVQPVEEKKAKISPLLVLGVLFFLMALVGAALLYVLVLRKQPGSLLSTSGGQPVMAQEPEVKSKKLSNDEETPLAQFMTTYSHGDDLYDDSFSIDSPTGEFLGECGVGISETAGISEPKKVIAFEVWLFDKNDIQTVTKVLMSEQAFNDPEVSQKLASKGEPELLEPDKVVHLETATLELEVRVVDLAPIDGSDDDAHFKRITLDLTVWPKE